ncbi:hypothetical protein [Streptomyces diacarni]|uniref:hypothetical protein n=1 Tax=Streptomyces diacarni TaxID=2800381 RepID=UPI001FE272F7|nr:hypothetical protein [Streptomyces diacarni]
MNHRTDTLIRDAETVVTMAGDEIPGGWVALSGARWRPPDAPARNPQRPAPCPRAAHWSHRG